MSHATDGGRTRRQVFGKQCVVKSECVCIIDTCSQRDFLSTGSILFAGDKEWDLARKPTSISANPLALICSLSLSSLLVYSTVVLSLTVLLYLLFLVLCGTSRHAQKAACCKLAEKSVILSLLWLGLAWLACGVLMIFLSQLVLTSNYLAFSLLESKHTHTHLDLLSKSYSDFYANTTIIRKLLLNSNIAVVFIVLLNIFFIPCNICWKCQVARI